MKKRLLQISLVAASFCWAAHFCGLNSPALADLPPSIPEAPGKSSAKPDLRQSPSDAIPVPFSAQILVLPFLVAGHRCTLTITDGAGKPLANAGLYLNQELYLSDSVGTVSFVVPDAENFELYLLGDGKKKVDKRKFHRVADRVAAEQDNLAEAAAALINSDNTTSSGASINYAPSVVCPGEAFVLVGKHFSDKPSNNYVDIDGLNAPVLSSSSDGILALAPARLRMGPLRELTVSVDNLASNTVEVDVATPFFNHVKTESDDVSPERGKLGMNGTNLACLIHVQNQDSDAVSLWSPKQEPLGKNNIVLSPGGEQNYLDIDMRLVSRKATEPRIDIALEQFFANGRQPDPLPPQLVMAAARAEIIRLERRKIAAESRLESLRQQADSATKSTDSDKREFESKALSIRLMRLKKMLASRKCIFESFGNTDAQYRQVLDDAAGGATLSLDQSTKPIVIISDGGVGFSGSASISSISQPAPVKKRRISHRMLEPVIRLLPPMTDEQLAASNALSKSSATITPSDSSNGSQSSDQPTLRQNFSEPEPGFSAAARGTANHDSSATPQNSVDENKVQKKSTGEKGSTPSGSGPKDLAAKGSGSKGSGSKGSGTKGSANKGSAAKGKTQAVKPSRNIRRKPAAEPQPVTHKRRRRRH